MIEVRLGDTIAFEAQTFDSDGAAVDADAAPTYRIWRNGSAVGSNANLTSSETGVYRGTAAITSGAGYAVGDLISVRAAATVDEIASKATIAEYRVVAARAEDALRPTTAGRTLSVDVSGNAPATIAAGAVAADAITSSALASSAVTEIQSGLATAAALTTVEGKIDTVDTVVDGIAAKTANLPSDPADASVIAAAFASVDSALTTVEGKIDTVDVVVDGIHAKTTNLPSDPADASVIAAAFASIDSALTTIAGYLDTEVTALLARLGAFSGAGDNTVLGVLKALASKTAALPSDIGGTYSPATDSLEAIKDAGVSVSMPDIGALTFVQWAQVVQAFVGGKSDVSDNVITFYGADGTTPVLRLTLGTTPGQRTAVALFPEA